MTVQETSPAIGAGEIVKSLIYMLVILAIVFISAGTLHYRQGWVFVGVSFCLFVINLLVMRKNPSLVKERFKPGENVQSWDKKILGILTIFYLLAIVIAPLDAKRFAWSGEIPLWIYSLNLTLYLAGHFLFLVAKKTNNYFSSMVRIQKDRGHRVCDRGPYRAVRHPGYTGGLIYSLATPVLLGSLWAFVPMLISCGLLVLRTAKEDALLHNELEGYREYAHKVRYRLLPGIW